MDAAAMLEASKPTAEIVRIPVEPAVRLQAALRMLNVKLAEQADLVARWREDIHRLARAARDLAASMESCQQNLDRLGLRADAASAAAAALDHTADFLLGVSVRA